MSIIITIAIPLIVAVIVTALIMACRSRRRERSISQFNRQHTSRYILNRLNHQTFTKAVNIVMDLVNSDGTDIEVIYKDEVIFNGYIDRDDYGNDTPHFWYNKRVLDANGIKY
mgnify:CR=1 FL=1